MDQCMATGATTGVGDFTDVPYHILEGSGGVRTPAGDAHVSLVNSPPSATQQPGAQAKAKGQAQESKRELVDLTPRLVEYGIYGEYQRWRDDYMKWRQGSAKGSKGEATIVQLEEAAANDRDAYKFWYPDQFSFRIRQTVSYWIAVFCFEGAVLFAMAAVFGWCGYMERGHMFAEVLSERPLLLGSCAFLCSTYLSVFEMMNIDVREDGELRFFWLRLTWHELHKTYGVEMVAFCGIWVYFLGACMYQISLAGTVICEALGINWPQELELPIMLAGGLCFTLGGLCECIYNKVWLGKFDELVWWVSVLDVLGGALFFLSSLPSYSTRTQSALAFIGAVGFCIVGALQLVMWKGGQFGLSLLAQLNKVAGSRGLHLAQRAQDGAVGLPKEAVGEVKPNNFSKRGLFFMSIYILGAAISLLNCCFGGGRMMSEVRDISLSLESVTYAVVLHLVLLLHSAGLQRLPKEQPFRTIMISVRAVALVMIANAVLNFYIFLHEDDHQSPGT